MKAVNIILSDLVEADLSRSVLWKYLPSRGGRLLVRAVKAKKNESLKGYLISGQFRLTNGLLFWGLLDGIDLELPRHSLHNRGLRLLLPDGGWFELANYNDSDDVKLIRGPDALASKIGLNVDEVFPVSFDFRVRADCDSPLLFGTFEPNPEWGLTRSEVMEILVNELDLKG